jgi:DNA-binding NarL/FixJ family response regulator
VNALALVQPMWPEPVSVTVRVVASDPVLRAGVHSALRSSQEIEVVSGEGSSAAVAVVVVDLIDDEALATVRAAGRFSRRAVLLVATSIDAGGVLRVVEAGIGGVLRRREANQERLTSAVLAVADGHGTIPADLLGEVMEHLGRWEPQVPAGHPALALDDREKAVLRMIADGHETAEIARALAYSARTVTGIVHDITHRLRLRNRAHAVAFALRHGLI